MSDHYMLSIAALDDKIAGLDAESRGLKLAVNALCAAAGIEPKYSDVNAAGPAGGTKSAVVTFRADQFVGKPLNTAVREYLQMRESKGIERTASAEEIHDTLSKHGFEFETKDRGAAVNNLKISLGKSNRAFKKVGNGSYGLVEWYGGVPRAKAKAGKVEDSDEGAEDVGGDESQEKNQ